MVTTPKEAPAVRCPKCLEPARVSRSAEPDVGLLVPVFACAFHGEFFESFRELSAWRFVDEPVGAQPSVLDEQVEADLAILQAAFPNAPWCAKQKAAIDRIAAVLKDRGKR